MPLSTEKSPLLSNAHLPNSNNTNDSKFSLADVANDVDRIININSNNDPVDTQAEEQESSTWRALKAVLSNPLVIVLVYLLVGTLTLWLIENWPLLDCVYFCVIALTTVGYGDISPQETPGKVFVMMYIVVGVGLVLGIVANGVQALLEQQEAYVLQLAMSDSATEHKQNTSVAQSFNRKLTVVLINVSIISLVYVTLGTIVWSIQEDISFIDALYFCIVTLTTVGFGDFAPKSSTSKIFAIFFILSGVIVIGYCIGRVADIFSERHAVQSRERILHKTWTVADVTSLDKDGDGVVKWAEFLTDVLVRDYDVRAEDVQAIRSKFDEIDIDNSGEINRQDITMLTRNQGFRVGGQSLKLSN